LLDEGGLDRHAIVAPQSRLLFARLRRPASAPVSVVPKIRPIIKANMQRLHAACANRRRSFSVEVEQNEFVQPKAAASKGTSVTGSDWRGRH
jgi:hypothetical protein